MKIVEKTRLDLDLTMQNTLGCHCENRLAWTWPGYFPREAQRRAPDALKHGRKDRSGAVRTDLRRAPSFVVIGEEPRQTLTKRLCLANCRQFESHRLRQKLPLKQKKKKKKNKKEKKENWRLFSHL